MKRVTFWLRLMSLLGLLLALGIQQATIREAWKLIELQKREIAMWQARAVNCGAWDYAAEDRK